VTFRLNFCNVLLSGCASKYINKLQLVQNAATRVLTRSRKYDHITPYLSELLHKYDPQCLLESKGADYLLVPPNKNEYRGGRTFSYLAPQLWNSLPTVSVSVFKSCFISRFF
ncbi:hypothetical protein C0J50_15907, partial [Silurus asotus]